MKIVLLAGGKGTRLWPATTDHIPKQFLKIFDNNTMIEKIYNQLCSIYDKKDIYIATNDEYKKIINQILFDFDNFIIEPNSNGTYSAILNISAYFKYKKNIKKNESICILPIDLNVNYDFFNDINKAFNKIKKENLICLLGVTPIFPSEQYGYIIHKNGKVKEFKEKPNKVEALELMLNNALWNTGILIVNLKKLYTYLNKYKFSNYDEFVNKYMNIPKGSFDINVLEKEKKLLVVTSDCKWSDIGIWENLAPIISDKDKYNTNIINFENKKVVNEGINNAIIINSNQGLKLIKKRNNIKIEDWGICEELNTIDTDIKLSKINILPTKNTKYQSYSKITIDYIITKGSGEIIIDNIKKIISKGDKLTIKNNQKYSIRANELLEIIEIQYGQIDINNMKTYEYN